MTDLLSQLRELADEWEKRAGEINAGRAYHDLIALGKAGSLRAAADELRALLPDQPEPPTNA